MHFETNKELYDFVYKYVKKELIFDVGSNIGEVSKKFIDKSQSKIVAVEPQKELLNNKNYKDVFAIENICVSNNTDNVVFYKADKTSTVSTCLKEWNKRHKKIGFKKIILNCTTIDLLIQKYGIPKYIKIDVEGFEDKVLEGLSQKIDLISFEFTQGFRDSFIKCLKVINKLGFIKLISFVKKKEKKRINGKNETVRRYKIVDEFINIKSIIEFFDKLPKDSQGDLLVISNKELI